ncbi:hypothetical protein, partial [Niallia circulans]|uniref:hypothetical protein n=1 Tax=Niallia circulans TaxID=1397 RepID=UPI001F34E16E
MTNRTCQWFKMEKTKGYLACLLFVPFALDKGISNHWRVCQERLRVLPIQKREKNKPSGYFFIEVLTLP